MVTTKLALFWKVTQPGINLDLTCPHTNGEWWLSNIAKICMSKYFPLKSNYMSLLDLYFENIDTLIPQKRVQPA